MKVFVDDHPVTGTVDFGSVQDGIDTGTAFTGTDNTASLQQALDYASPRKLQVFAPPGTYRFAGISADNTGAIALPGWVWLVAPGATFLVDEDTAITAAPTRDFMRATGFDTSRSRTRLELCRIEGVTFKGRWSHAPLAGTTQFGMSFLALQGYAEVVLEKVRGLDCRSKVSRSFSCDTVSVTDCRFERCASDVIRFIDCPNVLVHGNFIRDTHDNAIALHATPARSPAPYIDRPARGGLVVTGNRMVAAVMPNVLGAHSIVFANNTMQRCRGGCTIGLEAAPEGTNAQASVVVAGNLVEDTLQRYDGTPFPAQTRSSGALVLGGAVATADSSTVPPGEYDAASTSVLSPWGDSPNPKWGYLWTGTNQPVTGATEQSTAGSFNIRVSGNIVSRTLPAAAHYSDWGFGQFFSSTGWVDPAVTDNDWRLSGIVLVADMRNFILSDNIVFGHRIGAGLFLHLPTIEVLADQPFRGGVIKGNIVADCALGLTTSKAGDVNSPPKNSDLLIEGNRFDLDPYHKSSFRTSPIDGTWPTSAATSNFPCGINTNAYAGWTIRGNSFSNVYLPVGPTLAIVTAQAHLEDNLVICDPVAVGYSTTNRGVASVPPAGPNFRHLIVDGNPTSATWRALKNTCALSASAQPAAGIYVAGQVVGNAAPAVAAGKVLIGWARLTTGSAHVAGTDWSPLYCTVS